MNPPIEDPLRRRFVLVSVAMGIFLATIDSSIVNVSLPTMVDQLKTTFSLVQWVVLGYLLTVTTLLSVSYTHLRAHETVLDLVCRLLLEKTKYNTL